MDYEATELNYHTLYTARGYVLANKHKGYLI